MAVKYPKGATKAPGRAHFPAPGSDGLGSMNAKPQPAPRRSRDYVSREVPHPRGLKWPSAQDAITPAGTFGVLDPTTLTPLMVGTYATNAVRPEVDGGQTYPKAGMGAPIPGTKVRRG